VRAAWLCSLCCLCVTEHIFSTCSQSDLYMNDLPFYDQLKKTSSFMTALAAIADVPISKYEELGKMLQRNQNMVKLWIYCFVELLYLMKSNGMCLHAFLLAFISFLLPLLTLYRELCSAE
jgi:hypothetical protein